MGRAFQACAPDPWGTPHANTEFIGFLLQRLKNHLPGGGEEEQIRSMGLTYRTRRKERKGRPRIIVHTAKLQPSRATVLTPPSPLKDMHRLPRHMGSKVMEPMDSPLMSATPRRRPLQPTGRPPMQLLMDSLPLDILLQLPPRHTVSLSRGTALVLTTPPPLRLLPPRPPMQLSLHMALSPLTRRMDSSQQPPRLQGKAPRLLLLP